MKINDTVLSQIGKDFEEHSTKFLGLNIDESLTWKYHLNCINNKIARALFQIKQAKNILPVNSLRTLYLTMVHPYLSYGILGWGNASSTALKRTTNLQKRAIRTINKSSYNSLQSQFSRN